MTQEELDYLKTFLADEKVFLFDGYYRLRKSDNDTYEFAFLESDPCGATSVHPQITIEWDGDMWHPIKLLDFLSSPVQQIDYSDETADKLNEALKKLYEKCLYANNQVSK